MKDPFAASKLHSDAFQKQLMLVMREKLIQGVLDSVDGISLVLNQDRQILAANQDFLNTFGDPDVHNFAGKKPGDVLHCVYAAGSPGGCGSSPACAKCGSLTAFINSRDFQQPYQEEMRLSYWDNGKILAKEFRVRVNPIQIKSKSFFFMLLTDISSEKRRAALERIFVHDVMNTLTGLESWTYLLRNPAYFDTAQAATHIAQLTLRLKQEILFQKALMQAETGTLKITKAPVSASSILDELRQLFEYHANTSSKRLRIEKPKRDIVLNTERNLLTRILVNMIKNAFEAIHDGQMVRIWCNSNGAVTFNVWNQGHIPEDIALQIFQRSFSTKADQGRGLGTYSMRLLGESYLGGKVRFESTEAAGTTFRLQLPKDSMERQA